MKNKKTIKEAIIALIVFLVVAIFIMIKYKK